MRKMADRRKLSDCSFFQKRHTQTFHGAICGQKRHLSHIKLKSSSSSSSSSSSTSQSSSSIFERQMANRCSILPLAARRRHILKLSLFSSRLIGSCHFSSLNVILIFFVLVNFLATISESIYIPRSAYDSKGESSRTFFLRRYRSFGF